MIFGFISQRFLCEFLIIYSTFPASNQDLVNLMTLKVWPGFLSISLHLNDDVTIATIKMYILLPKSFKPLTCSVIASNLGMMVESILG